MSAWLHGMTNLGDFIPDGQEACNWPCESALMCSDEENGSNSDSCFRLPHVMY